jgi:hypothetical protein
MKRTLTAIALILAPCTAQADNLVTERMKLDAERSAKHCLMQPKKVANQSLMQQCLDKLIIMLEYFEIPSYAREATLELWAITIAAENAEAKHEKLLTPDEFLKSDATLQAGRTNDGAE